MNDKTLITFSKIETYSITKKMLLIVKKKGRNNKTADHGLKKGRI